MREPPPLSTGELSTAELLKDVRWLRRFVRRLVQDPEDAEDVTQDAWLSVFEHAPRDIDREGLRAWLARVARSIAARRWQTTSLRRHHEGRRAREARRAADGTAADALEELQRQHELVGSVLTLEEPYRSALVLRFRRERSYAEMARELGIAEAAARKRVSRGLALLRAQLARMGGEEWRERFGVLAWAPATATPAPAGLRLLPWIVGAGVLLAGLALWRARAGTATSGSGSTASDTAAPGPWSAAAPLETGFPSAEPAAREALEHLEPYLGCNGFAADVEGLSVLQRSTFREGPGADGATLRAEALIGWDPASARLVFQAFHSALAEFESSSEGWLAFDAQGALEIARTSFEPDGSRRRQRERLFLAGPRRLDHRIELEDDDGQWQLPLGAPPEHVYAGVFGTRAPGAAERPASGRHTSADEHALAGIEPFLGTWVPAAGGAGESWELAWGIEGRTLHVRATPRGREVFAHALAGWHHGERALVFLEFLPGGLNRGRCGLAPDGSFWREFQAFQAGGAVRAHRQRFVLESPDRWRLEREVQADGGAWQRLAALYATRNE